MGYKIIKGKGLKMANHDETNDAAQASMDFWNEVNEIVKPVFDELIGTTSVRAADINGAMSVVVAKTLRRTRAKYNARYKDWDERCMREFGRIPGICDLSGAARYEELINLLNDIATHDCGCLHNDRCFVCRAKELLERGRK